MIDPKTFYAKLDVILSTIIRQKTDGQLLSTILTEIEKTFGAALNFGNGRIYEEQDGEYVLVYPEKPVPANRYVLRIPAVSDDVSHVLAYGTYIFQNPGDNNYFRSRLHSEYSVPVAFKIQSQIEHWIFVYDLRSGWSIEEVQFCFNAVRVALNFRLYADSIQADLQQAAAIQQSLLPASPPQFKGYQLALRSDPTEFIVGDLYDFYELDDDLFGFCVGDVAGHGLQAALLVRDVITGLRMGLEKEMKMVHTVKKLNRVIHRSTYSTRFVSLFYGEIEEDGHLIYTNAGHPPALLVNGTDVRELKATGTILGIADEIRLHRGYGHLDPGGILVLYSDGVIERQNRAGKAYGIPRLKKLIQEHAAQPAQKVLEAIFADVFAFGHDEKWKDDTTAMVIKRADAIEELID